MARHKTMTDKLNVKQTVKVLMVCLGNICRSPTAHGVFINLIKNNELEGIIEVDSAGTSTYHIGDHPDPRSIQAASRRGYSLQSFTARQLTDADYRQFDYILAMDRANLDLMESRRPADASAKIQLLLDYADNAHESVPDPYYVDGDGFELVLDLVEEGCAGLLRHIQREDLSSGRDD